MTKWAGRPMDRSGPGADHGPMTTPTSTAAHGYADVTTMSSGSVVIEVAETTIVIARRPAGDLVGAIAQQANGCAWFEREISDLIPEVGPAALVQGF